MQEPSAKPATTINLELPGIKIPKDIKIDPADFKNLSGGSGPRQPSADEETLQRIIHDVVAFKGKYLMVPEIRTPLHAAENSLFKALDRMSPAPSSDSE